MVDPVSISMAGITVGVPILTTGQFLLSTLKNQVLGSKLLYHPSPPAPRSGAPGECVVLELRKPRCRVHHTLS